MYVVRFGRRATGFPTARPERLPTTLCHASEIRLSTGALILTLETLRYGNVLPRESAFMSRVDIDA